MVDQISNLNAEHVPLLEKMVDMVKTLKTLATKQGYDQTTFKYGFHAVPSMKLLHLHFISNDLNGAKMKTPGHWASFTTPFFIPLDDALRRLSENGKIDIDPDSEKNCKHAPPTCPNCNRVFSNSNDGVIHVKAHFQDCRSQHS